MTPDRIIRCPTCQGPASWYPCELLQVRRDDVAFVERETPFRAVGALRNGYHYYALRLVGLDPAFESDGALMKRSLGEVSPRSFAAHRFGRLGSSHCRAEERWFEHELTWPKDAYFQVEHKGRALWARDRSHATRILDFLASDDRRTALYASKPDHSTGQLVRNWDQPISHPDLRRIPTHFKTAKARPDVVRKLRRVLGLPPG